MTINEAKDLLRQWYKIKAGTACRWSGENAEIWGAVVFADEKILADKITNALSKVPKECQKALKLLYFEDIPEEEAASMLCVSRMRLKNNAYLGLKIFGEQWEETERQA